MERSSGAVRTACVIYRLMGGGGGEARGLISGLNLQLHPYFVFARNNGSDKTGWMQRLV